jgi:hypothetical protein
LIIERTFFANGRPEPTPAAPPASTLNDASGGI